MQDDFPSSRLRRQLSGEGDDLSAEAPPLMAGVDGHLAKVDHRAVRPVDWAQGDATDQFAIEIGGDMNVLFFFRQLPGGEIQSERHAQDAAAKLHQVAVAAGIVFHLHELQHIGPLAIPGAPPLIHARAAAHRDRRKAPKLKTVQPSEAPLAKHQGWKALRNRRMVRCEQDSGRQARNQRLAGNQGPERTTMHESANTTFHRLLDREILVSERRRMLSLAIVQAVILALILLSVAFVPGFVRSIYHDRLPVRAAFAAFSAFIAYELLAAGLLTVLLRRRRNFPVVGRYMNALIETSFPTLLLYLLTGYLSAPIVFGTWPALLYFVFIILSTLRLDFALSAFTGAVAAVQLFVLASVTLHLAWRTDDPNFSIAYHLTRSAVLFGAGLLAGSVGTTIKSHFQRALEAVSARDRVTNMFGQHVSPRVVERLLANGAAELSEMRRVCVMFVDIRGFTEAARVRSPAAVVARLDAVFEILVDIVDRHNGIVNKFLGDGLLAIFGAPIDDPLEAANAVEAARKMLSAIGASNAGNPWPIRLGIGIHIGQAVAGTVGTARRKEYTVIGDTVNLASRLESLNKEVGSELLVSDAVREAGGNAIGDALPLGPVFVRGYAEPVTVWRLV